MAFGLEAQIIPNLSYLLETIMSVFGFVSNYFPLVLISSWALIIGAIIPFFIPNPKIKLFIIGNLLIFRSLIGFIFTPENSKHASHVEMLDVGQGDSLLIQKDNNMAGLFDAGSAHGLSVAAWLRILLNRGITRIDFLGLSHLDEDHSSGVLNLEKIMDIKCIQLAKENYDTEKGVKYLSRLSPELRERVVSKGCFPFSWATDVRSLKGANGIMSGTYITLPNSISFLSMGDADKRAEIKLFNALNTDSTVQYEKAKTRILKISHHGSSTSTNPLLLKLYQPNVTWISSGLGNRFGHPREEVMNWIKALRIRNFRTDIDGFQSIGSLNNY
jgi:competence protein ComEC